MLHSPSLHGSPTPQWDHPDLQPFVELENMAEGECLGDDDELERKLIDIWQQAKSRLPQLPSAYLRLAAALQDFDRSDEAANVLREGIRRGHACLKSELITDFPRELTEEELRDSLSDPALSERALAAILTQGQAELAVGALDHVLRSTAPGSPQLDRLVELLARLIAVLIEAGKDDQATLVLTAVTPRLDPTEASAIRISILGEIIEARGWADEASRGKLAQFHLSGVEAALWRSVLHLSAAERRRFCASLRRECPRFLESHGEAVGLLERHLSRARLQNWLIAGGVIFALASAAWYLVRSPYLTF